MKRRILIIISLFFVLSCRRDQSIPFCELHPDQCVDIREVKDYFHFNLGSYWVYEEETSEILDSTYVIETLSDTASYYFDTRLHSDYDGYNYHYWPDGATTNSNIVEKSVRSTIIKKAKTKPGDFVAESYCFPFYPNMGSWIYSYGLQYNYDNVLIVDTVFANYTLLDQVFLDVVCISEEHTASAQAQPTKHYYSKGVGLIRKELIDSGEVWNLLRYNIEP
jgi:hypothetical protein